VYIHFIKEDAPDRFALADPPETSTAAPAITGSAGSTAGTVAVDPDRAPVADRGVDGAWVVAPRSAIGYRVVEVLFGQDTEGVGRTDHVTGELTMSGTQVTAGSFTADMTTVVSDENRRDNQFNGRLLDTATFPTATFSLTSPIELSSVPADGTAAAVTASGALTLRGVTNPVTFDVDAQKNGDTIQIVGRTDITFADYQIPHPNAPGITTQDHGLLEFDLRLVRA
jgi:polyisoprenoid-binding protein YceI